MNATPHIHRLLLAAALALSAGSVQAAQTTSSRPVEKAEPAAIQPGTDVPPPQPISDEVIGQEYDAYRQSVKGQKMYTVSYILLSDETEARQWIARLRSGASFEKAAAEQDHFFAYRAVPQPPKADDDVEAADKPHDTDGSQAAASETAER